MSSMFSTQRSSMRARHCPVCQEEQYADQIAFNHHVNSHFANEGGNPSGPSRSDRSGARIAGTQPSGRDQDREASEGEIVCCPICNFPLHFVSPAESTRHVNDCLNTSTASPQIPSPRHSVAVSTPLSSHTEEDFVFNESTLRTNGQSAGDDWVEVGWEGPARPNAWSGWVSKKVDKGDKWWDPIHGPKDVAEVPSNFSPGVINILGQILQRSSSKGHTRSAVLSREVIHIKSALTFDIGWGCGYRNALMAITSLIQAKAAYRQPFSENENGSNPGVRRIQGWIEEAWALGFDPEGKKHFKGKLLGSKKWVGTSDLYAMFTYKGIPCTLHDFVNDKKSLTKNAHNNLVRWVKGYFDNDRSRSRPGQSAFNVLMRTDEGGQGRGETVRLSTKFPLILQHSGHSRLIIGYEQTSRGEVNILVLDPGKTMHKDIRAEGMASLTPRDRRTSSTSMSLSLSRHSSRKPSHESINFARPYTNGESEITNSHDAPQLATSYTVGRRSSFRPDILRGSSQSHSLSAEQVPRLEGGDGDGEDGIEELDEEVDEQGWVRKKVKKVIHPRSLYDGEKWKVPDALQPFRVSAYQLSNHNEYQVLEFTGGPPLTEEERSARKKVTSNCIK